MNTQMKRWQRYIFLISLPVLVTAVFVYIYSGQHGMRCIFYELTGLYCPGCGSGRSFYAFLHGDWKSAFAHNVLFLPLGGPAVLVFLHEYVRLLFPALRLKAVFVPQWLAVGCCVLIFSFWILRNIPACSFLAP